MDFLGKDIRQLAAIVPDADFVAQRIGVVFGPGGQIGIIGNDRIGAGGFRARQRALLDRKLGFHSIIAEP